MLFKIIILYLIIINIFAFLMYGIDKFKAKLNFYRIKEKNLLTLSIIGGSFGSVLAMLVFRHKIKKKKFIITNALMIVIWSCSLLYIIL